MAEQVKKVTIDYMGSLFSAFFDEKNGFYYCPLCGVGEDKPIFFSLDDLIGHIRIHVKRRMGVPRVAQPRQKQDTSE
ncbi:MAG: hypothetical protein GU361_02315 [Desulfurococcales archaeon]|jgi:hypothetical protein|nr:hypothetical protein [Desulfurococcales archaeon]